MTFDPLPPGWQDLPARDRLLHTAHALFYRDGIRATGIDRVIAESGVTKVTFYRHFPSKNDLICAYLEYRHTGWMAWFGDALQRHAHALPAGTDRTRALAPALAEWLGSERFRGCAFINSVSELGGTVPEVRSVPACSACACRCSASPNQAIQTVCRYSRYAQIRSFLLGKCR